MILQSPRRALAARFFAASIRAWDSPASVLRVLLETTLFIGAALGLSAWLSPADPFGLASQFPWLWIVPALLALRYGTVDGVLGTCLLLAAWFALPWLTDTTRAPQFPQPYFLGGLVLVLVCGQFADIWNDRYSRLRAANSYLDERLAALTRSHYLLRLSHERIEQELLVRPVTLRDLLADLRSIESAGSLIPASALARCDALLRVLSQSCELEDAAIHRMIGGRLDPTALASTGEAQPLVADDALLALAEQSGELAHVKSGEGTMHEGSYLVCAPIVAAGGERLGLLVVRSMPFFALNLENLRLVTVLLGYYADGLRQQQVVQPVLARRPDCPPDFALELMRLHRLRLSAKVVSTLVAFTFEKSESGDSAFEQVRRMRRSLDLLWAIDTPGRHVIMMLLPLSGAPALEGFLLRIENGLRQQLQTDFAESRIGVHTVMLDESPAERALEDLLSRCKVSSHPELAGLPA